MNTENLKLARDVMQLAVAEDEATCLSADDKLLYDVAIHRLRRKVGQLIVWLAERSPRELRAVGGHRDKPA